MSEEKKKQGFAALSPERRKEIASRGGTAAHASGTAHRFTSESAKLAGMKSHERGTSNHWTTESARIAGAKGGRAAAAKRKCKCEHGKDEHVLRDDGCRLCDCIGFHPKNIRKRRGLSQAAAFINSHEGN